METKKEIRTAILNKRKNPDPLDWQTNTEAIASKVIQHPLFREATDIYCYVDCYGEVGTRLIMDEAWRLCKDVWVPRVIGRSMEFYRIDSLEDLKPGTLGIPEPQEGWIGGGEDGLMIMPGVAFDRELNRIGQGGGYYDRYLSAHPDLRKMAIAFEFQVMEKIPSEEYDIKPEILITEAEIYDETTK